ncbi:MAG: hypothetical protein M1823_004761 [Watsoniomyces obsoletus]|nr:MAG: hypothetical protein M1823_004761 [Watsoniomyces obsoletus]
MKLFTIASLILGTSVAAVSAAAVAPVDGQLTATHGSLGDGIYTSEIVDGKELFRFRPFKTSHAHEGGSMEEKLERRWGWGKPSPKMYCGSDGNSDIRVNAADIEIAHNQMVEMLHSDYQFKDRNGKPVKRLAIDSGRALIYCCNYHGADMKLSKHHFVNSMSEVDRQCGGTTALGWRDPMDKNYPVCGRTNVGGKFC